MVATRKSSGMTVPEEVSRLVMVVNGCKDDLDGLSAKITLVRSFVMAQRGRANLMDVMCVLHLQRALTINHVPLLRIIRWQKPRLPRAADDQKADAVADAKEPGLFVASALEACATVEEEDVGATNSVDEGFLTKLEVVVVVGAAIDAARACSKHSTSRRPLSFCIVL